MRTDYLVKERTPIWIALSDLYLDTALQHYHYEKIATEILKSPYSLQQVREIDKNEVFPVLYLNLISATGVWDGFHPTWLVEKIHYKITQRNYFNRIIGNLTYLVFQKSLESDWEKISWLVNGTFPEKMSLNR